MERSIFQFPRCFGICAIRPDEALSGWIMSVSAANRVSPSEQLRAWTYPIRNAYEADFSRRIPPLFAMASLSLVSPIALARIHRASYSLLGDFRYAFLSERTDGSYIHRYCPRCLGSDDLPYLRQKWRLDYQFLCEKHNCLLLDKCPSCDNPIDQSLLSSRRLRLGLGRESIFSTCPHCRTSLSKAPRILPPPSIRERLIAAQNTLHNLVVNPSFKHRYAGTVSSAKILHSFLLQYAGDEPDDESYYVGLDIRRIFLNHTEGVLEFLFKNRGRRLFSGYNSQVRGNLKSACPSR